MPELATEGAADDRVDPASFENLSLDDTSGEMDNESSIGTSDSKRSPQFFGACQQ